MPARSGTNVWLLLAATIAVNAVVFAWVPPMPAPTPVAVVVMLHALVLAQLSILCVWSAVAESRGVWTQAAPVPAVVLAAFVTARFSNEPAAVPELLIGNLAHYGLHAALIAGALWLVQRSQFWQRRTGAGRPWRYSTAHLLVAMTVVGLLVVLIRHSPMFVPQQLSVDKGILAMHTQGHSAVFDDERWMNITFALSSVALALACVVFWVLSCHWLLRLAGAAACALLLALGFLASTSLLFSNNFAPIVSTLIGANYLVQAGVICVWLGLGPILPAAPAAGRT